MESIMSFVQAAVTATGRMDVSGKNAVTSPNSGIHSKVDITA